MTKDEIFEEIRDRLQEALLDTVEDPWHYQDEDLERSIRAALRFLRFCGLDVGVTMDENGDFDTDPTEIVGVLISYRVAGKLLSGDLKRKLLDGEMGLTFRMGPDYVDTKTAANNLSSAGKDADAEFSRLLTIVLSGVNKTDGMFFGGPETSFNQ